jgi:hypothetical protein
MKNTLKQSIVAIALGAVLMVPSIAGAQSYHRQNQKNQWKDLAIGAGALGILGALTHNDTLTAIGAAGALYSAYRYDADGQCYGERWEHGRAVWVHVPDRDRHDSNWNRNDRDRDDHNWDRDWNRDRDWNKDRDRNRDRDWDRDRGGNKERGRGGDRNRNGHGH